MYNYVVILIPIISFKYINSVIKYNIEIHNETYSLDHQEINNSSQSGNQNGELINQNYYLCEDKKDCITCSFIMYQYAACYWDCDHSQCKTEYSLNSFSFTNDLSSIYKICSSCDASSNERMNQNCNKSILVEEINYNDKNGDNKKNETYIEKLNYSKVDFKGLLCKYFISNKYGKSESLFHLNITKYYRYINIFIELDYGLYIRHINLKNQKNYEIDTVGVNSIIIYIYTPENYGTQPFSIMYSFKMLKKSTMLHIVIFMTAAIVIIFSILLILIFIELKKGNMIKHGKKEYNLSVNTLIFNKTKYNKNIFKKLNKSCFFCSNDFETSNIITLLVCKKHIFHYICLTRWVRQNRLDKTNFFCPLCQKEEIKELSRSMITQEDHNRLLSNSKSSILNKKSMENKSDLNGLNKKDKKTANDNKDDEIEDKKENIISEFSIIMETNKNLIQEYYESKVNKNDNKLENEDVNEYEKKNDIEEKNVKENFEDQMIFGDNKKDKKD